MEQAVNVVARSALELELASKEKEISQLVDNIQRLQTILNSLQESSASKIAQLEEMVSEKDRMILELGDKLVHQRDYEEIKRELSILKSLENNTLENNSRSWESRDENKNTSDKPPDLTKENHKPSSHPENLVKHIKSEEPDSVYNVDNFGRILGHEIASTYTNTKREPCSQPSSPCKNGSDSPSPSPQAVNLTSSPRTISPGSLTPRTSPGKEIGIAKLQDCLRHNIDKYANETLNTLNISRCVRELLSVHNIGQRLFAKFVLGLSQGTVSELLSKPKPWDKLTEKGRDSYRKMHAWASDEKCINLLKSLVPRRGKESIGSGTGLSVYKSDDQGAEERIAQILSEAQQAMMKQQEQKSPTSSLPNGGTNGDNRSRDSTDDSDCKLSNSRDDKNSFRRSRKYENDDIPQEMVARIYQEELAKLIGQRVEEGFRTPRDQFERTQEEIRQALTIYHQELTRLSHLMPSNHHPNFNPFTVNGSSYNLSMNNSRDSAIVPITNGNSGHQDSPMDATMGSRSRSSSDNKNSEPEMRHHGSAFSLVRPKTETVSPTMNNSSSKSSNYRMHSPSPVPLLAEPKSSNSPGLRSESVGSEDIVSAASPLQRMQSITNSLLSQSSLPSLPNTPQRPAKAVLPPITQQQFDQYNNVNTEDIVKKVKEQLSQFSISQRLFGESVLGLSQGSVSDLLARPKPWHMLTQKGREPFIRMKIFLEDENAVHKLVASQYKIAPEKLMRTGSFGGATNPQGIMSFGGSNKINPRPPEPPLRNPPENRIHLTQNNSLYSSHNHLPRSVCSTPDNTPMSLTVSSTNSNAMRHNRTPQSITRGYSQPSVYEMAALTTDLDTQVITSRIKETLMAHNIGQKIFGEVVLGLSQGSVSELLSKPKPWHMLSIKGREPFIRMQMWLNDPHNVEMLQTIKNERREANKRRRTGGEVDGSTCDQPYGFAPPSPFPPTKKPRVLFTEEQKEALRLAFSLDPYPSTASIEFLGAELNLSVRTITNWFHNHRMRLKQHAEDMGTKEPASLIPPVREGMTFDPVQYRLLLSQRLSDRCREKQPQFGGYPALPFNLYSPYRNLSPLSSSGDDVGTLDLSMSSQQRNNNSTDNDDSNLSQDNLSDCDSPQRPSNGQPALDNANGGNNNSSNSSNSANNNNIGGSSNRRKPAMPQWVNPGLELSPENTDDEDDDFDDDDESTTEQENEIINGVCVRQTDDFDLMMSPKVETVHVMPVPAVPEDLKTRKSDHKTVHTESEQQPLVNGVADSHEDDKTTKSVFLDERNDDEESWDDDESKDRRKNIEKLQQRLEKEETGDDWEF